ncbi:MAG: hypothetical protein Kow00105_15100 [Phycisphaeraceae bacterium]
MLRRLTRPGMIGAVVSVLWLMVFLALYVEPPNRCNPALEQLGWGWSLFVTAGLGWGMGLFLLAMNDVLDARHDRAFEPERPIPSGGVTQRAVMGLALFGLLLAVGLSQFLGTASVVLTLLTLGSIAFYNLAGRFMPAVGIVTLGLIVGMAALIPNPRLAFGWPILLMMTHTIGSATVRHLLAGKRPRLTPTDGWGILIGWVFWCMVVLVLIGVRGRGIEYEGLRLIWLGPLLAAVVLSLLIWLRLGPAALVPRNRRATAERLTGLTASWLIVFNASWLLSAGLWWQGLVLIALLYVESR